MPLWTTTALALALCLPARAEEVPQVGDDLIENNDLQALPVEEAVAPYAPEPAVVDPAALWEHMAPEALLQGVLQAIEQRDFAGAFGRLDVLGRTAGGPRVDYERGRVFELQEDWEQALAAYDAAAAGVQPGPLASDVHFRRALVLDDLGRHKDAIAVLKSLRRSDALAEGAGAAIDLERGVADLRRGKERRGARRIAKALSALPEGAHPWMRARARHAVLAAELSDAAELQLEGNKKAARNLERRARAMKKAEEQVAVIARLGEVEYILAGLRDLGDAYLQLHDDFRAAPPPRGLSEDQVAIYREQVDQKAGALPRKALSFYEMGLELATRRGWEGRLLDDIRARHSAVREELEAG
jgi:tetratricopeptide (TPR) repeat protein